MKKSRTKEIAHKVRRCHDQGTALEVTLAGGLTDLHDFGSKTTNADGGKPDGSVIFTADGSWQARSLAGRLRQ